MPGMPPMRVHPMIPPQFEMTARRLLPPDWLYHNYGIRPEGYVEETEHHQQQQQCPYPILQGLSQRSEEYFVVGGIGLGEREAEEEEEDSNTKWRWRYVSCDVRSCKMLSAVSILQLMFVVKSTVH